MKLLLLFIPLCLLILNGCGEREEGPIPDEPDTTIDENDEPVPESDEVVYRNTTLGFALEGKTGWGISESTDRRNGKSIVLLTLERDDRRVDLRVTDAGPEQVKPLVRLDQRARDAQEEYQIHDVPGMRTHVQQFGNDYVRFKKDNITYEITGKPGDVDAVIDELIVFEAVEEEVERIVVEDVRRGDLPDTVQQWVDNLMKLDMMPMAQTLKYNSKQYIFATWGSRPTGGYSVKIREAVQRQDAIYVEIEYTSPRPGEMVTQALTHPYVIAVIDEPEKPVKFKKSPEARPRSLARLRGIEDLPNIKVESRSIKVFSPEPDAAVSDPVKVTGVANVHEANVEYRVLDEAGQIIKDGFTTAAAADEWGYYEFELTLSDKLDSGDQFTVELFYTDMKDGERRDIVSIPLNMK